MLKIFDKGTHFESAWVYKIIIDMSKHDIYFEIKNGGDYYGCFDVKPAIVQLLIEAVADGDSIGRFLHNYHLRDMFKFVDSRVIDSLTTKYILPKSLNLERAFYDGVIIV